MCHGHSLLQAASRVRFEHRRKGQTHPAVLIGVSLRAHESVRPDPSPLSRISLSSPIAAFASSAIEFATIAPLAMSSSCVFSSRVCHSAPKIPWIPIPFETRFALSLSPSIASMISGLQLLNTADYFFTAVFTIEIGLKVTSSVESAQATLAVLRSGHRLRSDPPSGSVLSQPFQHSRHRRCLRLVDIDRHQRSSRVRGENLPSPPRASSTARHQSCQRSQGTSRATALDRSRSSRAPL